MNITDIANANSDTLNRMIAETIMEEPMPQTTHDDKHADVIFSENMNWVCIPQCGSDDKRIWTPVNFAGVLKWTWKVIKKMNTEVPEEKKKIFHMYLDAFFPLGASTEADCCQAICRAALLAMVSNNPILALGRK